MSKLEKLYSIDKWRYFDLIDYQPHPKQRLFHKSEARFKIAICGRRFGKAIDIHQLIPTPQGMRRMAELQVGDQVFDELGYPINIVAVSEIMELPAYEVIFDDKTSVITHGEHEWLTYDKKARKTRESWFASHPSDQRRNLISPAIRTTREISQTLIINGETNHAVQLTEPVDFPKQDLPIDPYLLGVWLGDGSSNSGYLCISNQDEWIVQKLTDRGHKLIVKRIENGCKSWQVIGFSQILNKCNLINNKHVPVQYLYGSIEQRQELLFGLMDTDGTVSPNHVDFDNTNKNLADAVNYLVCSLGGKVTRSQRIGKLYGVDKKMCYRVHTGGLVDVFSLPRKLAAQQQLPKRQHYYRFIREVQSVGFRQVKCIEVATPSHLYLVGASFIPTHNSQMAAKEFEPMLLIPNRRYWIVGPTYDLGEKEFRIIWNDMMIKLGLAKERNIKRSYAKKQGDLSIEFPWNTRIEVRSADRPENLVGEGLHGVIMSEAAKHTEDTWDRFIRPALTDFRGTAVFPTTPEGQNWLYQMWKMGRDPNEPDFESWQFPSWDNPHVYPGGINDPELILTKRTTPEESFLQEYAADFTSFSGKIYQEWDEAVHVQAVPFLPQLPNYIAFDWGFAAPMAAIEFQIDAFQRVRVWREHYKSRIRLRDFLYELKSRVQPPGYHLDLTFGDAADPEAVITVSEDFAPCFADPRSKQGTGGGTLESGKREGVELVKGCLKQQEVDVDESGAPIEQPWLIVDHSCVNLIREFNNYRIADAVGGRDPLEKTFRRDDHALDALRYGLMHVLKLGATMKLSDVMDIGPSGGSDAGFFVSGRNFV